MKKIFALLTFLILVGIFIPAVSAVEITPPFDDIKTEQSFDSSTHLLTPGGDSYNIKGGLKVTFTKVQFYQNIHYAALNVDKDIASLTEGNIDGWYKRPSDDSYQPLLLQVRKTRNAFNQVTKTVVYAYFTNWDIGAATGVYGTYLYKDNDGLPGAYFCEIYGTPSWGITQLEHIDGDIDHKAHIAIDRVDYGGRNLAQESYIEGYTNHWYQFSITQEMLSYKLKFIRERDGLNFYSAFNLYDDLGTLIMADMGSNNKDYLIPVNQLRSMTADFGGNLYTYNITEEIVEIPTPDTDSVTVYIRNSQTNALLANAHIDISANVNGSFYDVANETVPSGIYSIDLQPTGGGLPNPDFYRLIVTAEGYNSIMPYIDFEFDEAATIYAYLDPIGGAPEDENNTFIDFYVRDMSANPISGVTVNFGGYTLITNSAGYTIFEVDKSKTYSWTVSKSGYGSLTGNVVIGTDPRYTINTVLAPAITPTIPTAIPTSTPISPTPTMTAPTGEPVSNWLEWFAAHFGMILGGGAEIGKIFMWLCFSVPVGVYVGKESKAGAAGFMAGAGIVTLFFVLIGWVPIWLLVLLVLIIGLLYAKIFNNSDNGGGR